MTKDQALRHGLEQYRLYNRHFWQIPTIMATLSGAGIHYAYTTEETIPRMAILSLLSILSSFIIIVLLRIRAFQVKLSRELTRLQGKNPSIPLFNVALDPDDRISQNLLILRALGRISGMTTRMIDRVEEWRAFDAFIYVAFLTMGTNVVLTVREVWCSCHH